MSTSTTDLADMDALHYLWAPDLDPLFWREGRAGVISAWYGHVPFAHWVVGATEPRTLVELGTHNGVSYSAFCEAVVRNGFNTCCYAVDTWKGDDQAGCYGEEVYLDLRRFHDDRYGAFSELLRCTFNEALPYFADSSVDLLHIDGFHTYEAVRQDFEGWQPKLSESAIVLFHDTNVRERNFGVWRFWEELRVQFPSFEFLHGHGLGVLAVGRSISSKLLELCSLRDPVRVHAIRQRFSLLGERWSLRARHDLQREEEIASRDALIQSLRSEAARFEAQVSEDKARAAARFETQVSEDKARIRSLENEATELMRRLAAEQQLRARAAQRAVHARAELAKAVGRGIAALESTHGTRSAAAKVRLLYISGEPDTPGSLYRVVRHVEAAIAAGMQASWIRLDELLARSLEMAGADLIIMWRVPWDERIARAVETAHQTGARVVFDIDDLLVDPDQVRDDVIDGIRTSGWTAEQWKEHCIRFHAAMVAADYCTAPTEELATNIRRFFRPALVLSNGFDRATYQISRRAVRRRRSEKSDELVRIGYAGGSRTHQRDFATAADAVARVLRERPQCRLVVFQFRFGENCTVPSLIIEEFPAFRGIENQIEWRDIVPLPQLPEIIASFDINIAPLEVGNPFCEAKSELKFFEAALVDIPTVASPTGPYRRAIRHGVTGFLANHRQEWYTTLLQLVDAPLLRQQVARAAQHDVLWRYGPLRRADSMLSAIPQLRGDCRAAARAFALEMRRIRPDPTTIRIPDAEIVFEADKLGDAEVTVVVPLHNCAPDLEEALESVRSQTLEVLDLIVVDDASTDPSLSVAAEWARRNANHFNRIIVLRNRSNAGAGPTRNAGIDAADTPWVLPLDASVRLLPGCGAVCLAAIRDNGATFAYLGVRQLGKTPISMGNYPFDPSLFMDEKHIEVMAIVSKEAWAAIGGYSDSGPGSENFGFCCRLVQNGLWGCPTGDAPLAEYRG
jgi:glycosyltransferase involved in cell wall biosynthesis